MADRDYADVSDAILAACHQQGHTVPWVYLPGIGGNVQEPAFRNEAIKDGKHHFFFIRLKPTK